MERIYEVVEEEVREAFGLGPMKCYLAGPISDTAHRNEKSFEVAKEIVEDYGYEAVSPLDFDKEINLSEHTWSDLLRRDLKLLADCDIIALLPGWEESKGAQLEYQTAVGLDLITKEVDLNAKVLVDHEPDKTDEDTILTEAQRLVYGPREADYGHPYNDYTKTAALWSAILETEVTAKEAALCMVAVKISREVHRPKRDNLVDIAGYAAVADRIETYPHS